MWKAADIYLYNSQSVISTVSVQLEPHGIAPIVCGRTPITSYQQDSVSMRMYLWNEYPAVVVFYRQVGAWVAFVNAETQLQEPLRSLFSAMAFSLQPAVLDTSPKGKIEGDETEHH